MLLYSTRLHEIEPLLPHFAPSSFRHACTEKFRRCAAKLDMGGLSCFIFCSRPRMEGIRLLHLPPTLLMVLVVLAAAVVVVVVFRRLRLSPVLGYLAAGALVGPFGLGLLNDTAAISHMAEFGVVFLMFLIGLELSFERLMAMRKHVFGLGTLQVLLTSGAIIGISLALGLEPDCALVIGGGLALSSTALVLQVLEENHKQNSQMGRIALSVLLMQDMVVVPMLVLVPLLGTDVAIGAALGRAGLNAIVAMGATFLVGRALLRPLFRLVASAGTSEIFEAFTLLLVLGVSTLFHASGLSMAMGAFVAGLLVAETEYKHQVEADILPFKSLLLGLFFMFVGMQLDFKLIVDLRWSILSIVFGLMALKTLILTLLCRTFGMVRGKSWHTGLLLSQGGEFGFILFSLAGQQGVLSPQVTAMLLVAVTCSMALTPLAYHLGKWMAPRLNASSPNANDPALPTPNNRATFDLKQHVVIVGFGRVGQTIGRLLAEEDVPYIAIEMNAEIVTHCREAGMPVFYGDGAQPDLLKIIGIDRAVCAVVTVNSFSAALRVVASLEITAPDIPLLARSSDLMELKQLEAAGADLAISEKYEAALQLGREVLRHSQVANSEIGRIIELYRARDYELAAETTLARALDQPRPAYHADEGKYFTNVKVYMGKPTIPSERE